MNLLKGAKSALAAVERDTRFLAGVVRKKPFQVLLQVTNRCNMTCGFCDFWPNAAPAHEELTLADYQRIARELTDIGSFLVSIEGGEPLIRKDLVEIVRAFGRRHVPMLFTNGWMVTSENAKALFDAGLSHASVSIDFLDRSRHDGVRGLAGTSDRAWRAVEIFRDAAPRGGKQAHVMTVIMKENLGELEGLFETTAALGVGHEVTLLSDNGYRRGKTAGSLPTKESAAMLHALWKRFPHVKFFEDYFTTMELFLDPARRSELPTCHAGAQSFNVDHVGNVAACIERIDRSVGSVKTDSIATLLEKLTLHRPEIAACQDCWTACRGAVQALGDGGSPRAFRDLVTRMRTT